MYAVTKQKRLNQNFSCMLNIAKNTNTPSTAPVGILAGGGPLPGIVAKAVMKTGRSVFICALKGFGDTSLEVYPHEWVAFGSVGRILKNFRSANCQQIVMIGHVKRPEKSLIIPDWGALFNAKTLIKIARGGDDHLLSGIAGFLETKGFSVIGAHELIPDNLIDEGAVGEHHHKGDDEADIVKGFEVLCQLGKLDVGQSVVVSSGHVLAVEAAEGTDEMLRRVAKLRNTGGVMYKGGVLVKGPKPGQDLRVDMPVIGPVTVELVAEAGLSGIVVRANSVLCHDLPSLRLRANELGIFIEGRQASG
jgi:UDP-2,3-diacylglucosamine hydrolase